MTARRAFRLVARGLAVVAAAGFIFLGYIYLTLPDVRALATGNPGTTAWMEMRTREAVAAGKTITHDRRWVPYNRISPHVKRAVIVAEDGAFWDHEGIDIEQIKESIEVNLERGRAVRGASTITQQLAKNLYLSPSRNPIRKLKELIITRRLEAALPKARILEIYLNVIEWGDGVWGAEAASRRYFGIPASALSPSQSALLAAAIINPRALNPARPTPRLLRRQQIILRRMGGVTPPTLDPVMEAGPPPRDIPPYLSPGIPPGDPVPEPQPPKPPEGSPDEPRPAERPSQPPVPAPCPVPPCATRPPR